MKEIVFWGATGQAVVLEEMLSKNGFTLVAVADNNSNVRSPFDAVPILHGRDAFKEWIGMGPARQLFYAIAIGGNHGNARHEIGLFLESCGLRACNLIHPTAFVAESAQLNEPVQVLAQAAVCARVKLGANTIINTSASVDHECLIGDGVHIGPGAKLAGCVEVGDNSFIGTGAVILPRIKIGSNVTIGAGSVVTKDIPSGAVAFGNPAKIKSHTN